MIFRFDRYTLNTETRTLCRQDTVVILTPKVFQTLLILVENQHRVMSKAELFEQLWPRQAVQEANLTQNISILRKALEEAKHGKRYIETFHGHGYRFVEPVNIEKGSPAPSSKPTVRLPHPEPLVQEAPTRQTEALLKAQREEPQTRYRNWIPLLALAFLPVGIIVILSFAHRQHRAQKPPAARSPQVTTLVRMEGAQYQPSWSADGKELAFVDVAPDERSSSIEILSAADTSPRRVLSSDGALSSPVWSPDGRSLAFIEARQGKRQIRIFSLRDGRTRTLTALFPHRYGLDYRHMDWSSDGNLLVVDDKAAETDPLSLYLINVKDGGKLRLSYPDMDIIGDTAPRFAPDGSHVAFIRVRYRFQNAVMVVPVSGGEVRQLTDEEYRLGDVDWQTNNLVIFSRPLDNQFRFWRSDLRQDTSHAMQILSLGTDLPSQFSIARHSSRMAFSGYGPDLNIWSLDLTGGVPAASAWHPVIRSPGLDIDPILSPDGSKLAFLSDSSGTMRLWVSSRDGIGMRQIYTGGLFPSAYCWTSGGESVIFSARLQQGLYEASLPGSSVKQLTHLLLSHPACSPDGSSVYAIDNNFVYRLSPADGTVLKISDDGGAPIAQSKDGRYLYMAHGRMNSTISQLDLKTGVQIVVIHTLAPGYSESWALTSRGILFLKMENSGAVIMFHDLATGQEKPVASFSGDLPPVGLSRFSVSPDEKKLYVVRADPVFSDIEATNLN